tara:strand:+ start:84 stop:449 length:366 start_codon:yes stop_codon:yes gene_type:complete
MSDIQQVYSKKSILGYSLDKNKGKQTKSIPIPINNKCHHSRVGINEVNEIDGINQKMKKQEKSYEDLRKIVSSDNNLPPSSFNPNTPPEHNIIYKYIYNNDCSYLNHYNQYGLKDDLVSSL